MSLREVNRATPMLASHLLLVLTSGHEIEHLKPEVPTARASHLQGQIAQGKPSAARYEHRQHVDVMLELAVLVLARTRLDTTIAEY